MWQSFKIYNLFHAQFCQLLWWGRVFWSSWKRIRSFSASPVILFSCIPWITQLVLKLSWLSHWHITVIVIIISINRFGYCKQPQVKKPSSFQFSRSVVSNSLQPHELQHARPPCPSPSPGVHSDSHPSRQWCHPAISSSVVPFSSCPQSLPASESFPVSQLFTSGGQSIGISALPSFLPMNTQDWSPFGWTGWISLQSKGLSRVFSNTTLQSINSSALSLLHRPTLTSIHDYWKNQSLDQMDLCWQCNVSAFEYSI